MLLLPLIFSVYSFPCFYLSLFFFNDTATTEIYTLSLHDALPISSHWRLTFLPCLCWIRMCVDLISCNALETDILAVLVLDQDRKSTRLNSSHANISYAVFCLKKKTGGISFLLQNSRLQFLPRFC